MWPFKSPAPSTKSENQETVEDISPSLKLNISDNELVKNIDRWIGEAQSLKKEMEKVGNENERYWKGSQLDFEQIRDHQAKIVDNRIFVSVETIIPRMTSQVPEPTLRLKDPELRENVKQILMNLWSVPNEDSFSDDMQKIFETITRHWFIHRIGVIKYRYDPEIDDIRTEAVRPDTIVFDSKGTTVDDCRFIAQYIPATLDELIEMYPNKKEEILASVPPDSGGSKIRFIEFWTNDYVCHKFNNIILDKKKNPNFDYGDMSADGQTPAQVKFNLFKHPRKPFIVLNAFNLGKSVYDDTSLIDQSKTLQDGVNKRKRQISDNADDNGVLVGSGDFIEKKVLEAYTGAPDEKLWLKQGNPQEAIHRIEPKQLQSFVFEDLQHSALQIDDIFATHDPFRGISSGGRKTKAEVQRLMQADYSRLELFSRALDRIAQEWYFTMLHMYLVFKTKPVEVNSNDEEGTTIIFDRTKFINPETNNLYKIIIRVKQGSAMSIDKNERRDEAMELIRDKLIDPITFFERLDYSNPQEMAKRAYLFATDPIQLFPDLLAEKKQKEAQQAQQQLALEANKPIPEGTAINLPNGQQG